MLEKTSSALDHSAINPHLKNMGEDVMGFLNEIQLQYPNAISFASGRPDANYFDISDFSDYFNLYVETQAALEGKSSKEILNNLGQYNKTKGFINNELAKYFQKDEQIIVQPKDILVTVGTQEAIVIGMMTLCDRDKDVIIVEDPAYVGITHFSLINGYNVAPIPVDFNGISLTAIEEKIHNCIASDKRVKIVYVIPDYQNPTGSVMSLENRYRLLDLADKYDFLIFEDNAYGDFSYQDNKPPTLKSLDRNKRVVYLRSFSKTLYPSLRLSAMIADQTIIQNGIEIPLSDLMAKTKGYITVNTPSFTQAAFGGMLHQNDYSLLEKTKEKVIAMQQKRDQILASLNLFLDKAKHSWAKGINWNTPEGGFFITITTPFAVDKSDVILCAEKFNLIFTPMAFFYFGEKGKNEIRLAFSNVSELEIKTGIERLSKFFKYRISSNDFEHQKKQID